MSQKRGELSIGEQVMYARQACNMSRAELADISGVSVAQLYRIEGNRKSPTVTTLLRIAEILKCSFTIGEDSSWMKRNFWTGKGKNVESLEKGRMAVTPVDHGKYTTYNNYGCRCHPCTEAKRIYRKNHRARKREDRARA